MPPLLTKDTQQEHLQLLQRQHLAPYVGECKVNDTSYLIWEASGGEYTLEDYIEMDDGWVQLAVDLGLSSKSLLLGEEDKEDLEANDESSRLLCRRQQRQHLRSELAAEVLRQMLKGLAYCHSYGIVHRDIKVHYFILFCCPRSINCRAVHQDDDASTALVELIVGQVSNSTNTQPQPANILVE